MSEPTDTGFPAFRDSRLADGPIEQVGTPEDHVAFLRAERESMPRLLASRIEGAPWNRPDSSERP